VSPFEAPAADEERSMGRYLPTLGSALADAPGIPSRVRYSTSAADQAA
jgi:hypothetical protein